MNVQQALNAAEESKTEGLCGLYPMAAQVLAEEVLDLREKLAAFRLHIPSGAIFDKVISAAYPEDVAELIAVGSVLLGDTDGDEIDDWDVEFKRQVIDAINESRPSTISKLALFMERPNLNSTTPTVRERGEGVA